MQHRGSHVQLILVLALGLFGSGLAGCNNPSSPPPTGSGAHGTSNAPTNKDDYPVFPNPDAGADPAVSAADGGKGFTGEGWETNTSFDLIGDPRAVKGGVLRDSMVTFPGTLRMGGPEWNTAYNYEIVGLVYETLLTLHPASLEYIPALATHWKIDPDRLTFRFRLDPNARFSNGAPVTSEDVIASWKFHVDKGLEDLYFQTQLGRLEAPIAESRYIVRIKAKSLGWENFLTASNGFRIFPAAVLKNVTGASYLKDYNFKFLPGTGPYIVNEEDVKKGQSITIHRRKDYWAEKYRVNIGQYNFDEIRNTVVRDENLAFEKFKKGELDYYYVNVNRSKLWVEEMNTEAFQRGVLRRRAVFNNYPANKAYIAFNTRRKPWDDIRMRKALTLLFNRAQIIEKLFLNLSLPQNSYFPGTIYDNPKNPKNLYDPQEALKLIADAGWKTKDAQGRLTKDGRPLEVDVIYGNKPYEPWLTIYQEDLRKVGIGLNLRFVTPETRFKMVMQRQFEMTAGAWGAGSVFPEPRAQYHSETADLNNNNNITGFKNKRVDELTEAYEKEFDTAKRTEMLKELDYVLSSEHHYMWRWYDPAQRIGYSNKFGMPQGTFSRVGDYFGTLAPGIPQLWWVDPAKAQAFDRAMADKSIKLDIGPVDDRYWQEKHGGTQTEMEAQPKKP